MEDRSSANLAPIRAFNTSSTATAPSTDGERAAQLATLHSQIRSCRLCVERGYIPSAHPLISGRHTDRIMVIGQAPGHVSVEKGRPFSGPAGRVLTGWLVQAGFEPGDLHEKVYLSSLTKCDPGRSPRGNGDRKPSPAEIALCRPYLEAELTIVRPAMILLLGALAITAFLGPVRLDDVVGQIYDHNGAKLLPLPHSSGVSRWLNTADHQALLKAAIGRLAHWRSSWLSCAVPDN